MSEALDNLLQTSGIWRASSIDHGVKAGIPSAYPELDRQLPGGGWPRDGVTELLHDHQGLGELRLITPALARLSREQTRWITWIAPPYIPYAPALAACDIDLSSLLMVIPGDSKDALWAMEKALLSHSCSAVLAWPGDIRNRDIRRLQLAAREGNCWSILFRGAQAARQASPAELRIQLEPSPRLSASSSIQVCILKRRGGWRGDPFPVSLRDNLNRRTPFFPELIVPGADEKQKARDQRQANSSSAGQRDNERLISDSRRLIGGSQLAGPTISLMTDNNPDFPDSKPDLPNSKPDLPNSDGEWNGGIELH